jgi:hypothetical protein
MYRKAMSKEKRNRIEKLTEKELVDKLFSEDASRAEVEKTRMQLISNGKKILFGEALRTKFKESLHYEENSALTRQMWPLLAARLGFAGYEDYQTKVTPADRGQNVCRCAGILDSEWLRC